MSYWLAAGKDKTNSYELDSNGFFVAINATTQQPTLYSTHGGYQSPVFASPLTIDFSKGAFVSITLTGSIAITIDVTKTVLGGTYYIDLIQGGAGSYTATWAVSAGSIVWANKTPPVLTTAVGGEDVITLTRGNSIFRGSAILNYG